MFCSNCGKEIPENALFCPSCGKSLSPAPATPPAPSQQTPTSIVSQQSSNSSSSPDTPSSLTAPISSQPKDSTPYPSQSVSMPVLNQQPAVPHAVTATMPVSPTNLGLPPLAHKNLWERFKENHHVDEPNLLQIDFNDPNTLAAMQQIMGSGYYHYLTKFQQIQTYGKSGFNWASMFLGIFHAGYRNVWHEWLEKMKWVLLIYVIAQILPLLFALFSAPTLVVTTISFAYFMSFPVTIYQIIVANSFDKIYMRHIQNKLISKDFSPDESMARSLKVGGLTIVISIILSLIAMNSLTLLFN